MLSSSSDNGLNNVFGLFLSDFCLACSALIFSLCLTLDTVFPIVEGSYSSPSGFHADEIKVAKYYYERFVECNETVD